MSEAILDLTCTCGGRLHLVARYAHQARYEREAFDKAHEACRAAAAPVVPGPCWHDSGVTWPTGDRPRCELQAGHAGAHQCDRGPMGGTAVWAETTPAPECRAAAGQEAER